MTNNNEVSPESYDSLLERVLSLEMYIEKNGLDLPENSLYPKVIHIVELLYSDISTMILQSKSYPMGISTYNILKGFKTRIEMLGISTETIRWYQKPSMWPDCIRNYISKRSAKRFTKQSKEDNYGN